MLRNSEYKTCIYKSKKNIFVITKTSNNNIVEFNANNLNHTVINLVYVLSVLPQRLKIMYFAILSYFYLIHLL